jgi:hypothetical protein
MGREEEQSEEIREAEGYGEGRDFIQEDNYSNEEGS